MKLTKADLAFILVFILGIFILWYVVQYRYDTHRAAALQIQIDALEQRETTCMTKLGAINDFVHVDAVQQDGKWYRMSVAHR